MKVFSHGPWAIFGNTKERFVAVFFFFVLRPSSTTVRRFLLYGDGALAVDASGRFHYLDQKTLFTSRLLPPRLWHLKRTWEQETQTRIDRTR